MQPVDALHRLIRDDFPSSAFHTSNPNTAESSLKQKLPFFSCERDDETNPEPFDQIKLFSQAIFQRHISSSLIREVVSSHWHHLSSSSQAPGCSYRRAVTPVRPMLHGNSCQSKTREDKLDFHSQMNHKKTS